MRVASFFAGIGGFDLGFELAERDVEECLQFCRLKSNHSASECCQDTGATCDGSATSEMSQGETAEGQTSTVVGFLAKTSPWPENVRVSLVRAAACSMSWCASWLRDDLATLFGRMFPDCSPPTEGGTSELSSTRWPTSGISEPGGCWTRSTSEWPSGGDGSLVCSLRAMLDGDVPGRYYLSPRAAAGILRRAEKRGRELPGHLQTALQRLAQASGPKEAEDLRETSAKTSSPERQDRVSGNPASTLSEQRERTDPVDQATSSHHHSPPVPDTTGTAASSTQCEAWMAQSVETVGTVRRLTPTECERLQGFPLGWTIPKDISVIVE